MLKLVEVEPLLMLLLLLGVELMQAGLGHWG
jgi:hypothetical protein